MKNPNETLDIKHGDIGLVVKTKLINKIVSWFMDLYRKILKLPPRRAYNHCFLCVNIWGQLYVVEALAKGITATPYIHTYGGKKNHIIKTPIDPLSKDGGEEISKIALTTALENTEYDFLSLFEQIWYILTGKWPGKTGPDAEKRMNCAEAVADWWDKYKKGVFETPASTNPLEIDLNPNFKLKYDFFPS